MLAKFPESKITEEVWNSLEFKYPTAIINWIINSKYRTSVKLSSWLEDQLTYLKLDLAMYTAPIASDSNPDIQMLHILRYVRQSIRYKTDATVWSMAEKWQTGEETVHLGTGDCEDGAILMYLIARIKGVPANRLMIFAGDVDGGGHCWLGYKPNSYPLDWVFLDWCYYVNLNSIDYRNKFNIQDNNVYEYAYTNESKPIKQSNYLNIWFGFNEIHSYKAITYDI